MKVISKFAASSAGKRSGMALVLSVFSLLAAATMVAFMMSVSLSANRESRTTKESNQTRYLAEGAIEAAKKQVATAIANWKAPPAAGTASLGGRMVPWTVTPTGFDQIATDPSGIQQIVTGYQIEATATVSGVRHTARRLVNAEATPIFQFAVFYDDDLEINPGPSMTLGGRVHSNADMYLNCGGTLTVNTNYLHAVGSVYRTRKDDPSRSEGTVRIRQWVENPFDSGEPSSFVNMHSVSQMAGTGVPGGLPFDATFLAGWDADGNGLYTDPGDFLPWGPGALDFWSQPLGYMNGGGHTVLDQAHGTIEAVVPHIGSISMYEEVEDGGYYYDSGAGEYLPAAPSMGTHEKGYFHSEAGLVILIKEDGTVQAHDGAGLPIALGGGVVGLQDMYDARQGGDVKVLEIDVAALAASGHFPDNGLLYAAHYGAGTGKSAKGIRLVEGFELPGKLTVVSENSAYIQGDFNTVAKKGAAVIADAVNLLSNSWDDSKAKGTLPTAAHTTFNVAVITGNQITEAGGTYNGGLENLPRFHENWSGKNCIIRGSFVNTWESRYASGAWKYGGDRYTAPARLWSYDTAFNSVANLPPYTPVAVTARDVAMW